MKQLRSLFAFFIYSNLFIALLATAMVYLTARLLLRENPDPDYTGFVFFSTLCSYSFHYYFSSRSVLPSARITWIRRYRFVHIILFIAGLAGVIYFLFYLYPYWFWLALAAGATFLYSAPKIPHTVFQQLRKVAIGKTIFLAFIWMYVTTILPVIVSGREWNTGFVLYAVSRFFYIYSICILFDYRDREDDRAEGVRSLITYLSEKNITRLFIFSLVVFAVSTAWMLDYGYEKKYIILVLLPGLIIAALYNYARRHFSDFLYYFILDGLMALPALLTWLAGI